MRFLQNPLLTALLAFVIFLSGLGAVGFVGPDEARYADVARGMLLSGDYVTPRLFGEPWFEKPPLYYWIASQLFRFTANEQTARLPSAIAAILFLLIWFRVARRQFGQTTAMLATIFLASTLGWIGFAHAAAMDMLFAVTLDLALLLLALWFWERRPAHLYGFYALLGLATLAKGPLAVGLAGLVAIAYVATFREWGALRKLVLSPATAAFVAIAAPWYVLCYAYNGEPFVEEFLIRHNLARLVSAAELGHGQPFWFYIPILLAGLFPWSAMLLLPLVEVARKGSGLFQDQRRAFLFWWIALPFLFFSLAENKLPGYLLPILPPLTLWIAILAGAESPTAGKDKKTNPARLPERLPLALIGVSALLLLTVPLFAPLLSESLATGLRRALADWSVAGAWTEILRGPVPVSRWILLAGAVGFSLYFLWQKQALGAAYMALTGVAVCMLAITAHLAPSINRVASTRPVAERILSLAVPADEVAVFRIHRNQAYQLSFYLASGLREWSPDEPIGNASLVVAGQDDQIPFAQPLSFFPGQRIRLWQLTGVRIKTESR
jgi:4-amino-4-deoxy-L-arabinose transferase-like glycosyltransferase